MKNHHLIRYLILVIPLAVILSTPHQRYVPGFFADEAVYYAMTSSLASDFDLTWTRQDLERICETYPAGPVGVILRQNEDHSIVYAKPLIYPFVAAFFFVLLGPKGILCLNFLCFWAIFRWLAIYWGDSTQSTLLAAGTLVFSAFLPYTLWIHPEIFTAFLLAGFCYHWMRRNQPNNQTAYYWMALFLVLATAVKPPLIILGLLVVYPVFAQKKFRELTVFIALLVAVILLTILLTGAMNPYQGNRKIFHTSFPLDSPLDMFDRGDTWSSADATFYFNHNVVGWNLFYFLAGRFTGAIWYFFPGIWLAILALLQSKNRDGRRLLLIWSLICLIQIILIPTNYHGGGGALGNRYFVILYPVILFALPRLPGIKARYIGVIIGAALSGAFLIHPWYSSYQPGEFTKAGLFAKLPVEWTLAGAYPVFAPTHSRVSFPGINGHFYFLDRNISGKIDDRFDIYSDKTTRFIVELSKPATQLEFFIRSSSPVMSGTMISGSNHIDFSANSSAETRLIMPLETGHHRTDIYGIDRWVYSIKCRVSDESDISVNPELRRPVISFRTAPSARKKRNPARIQSIN